MKLPLLIPTGILLAISCLSYYNSPTLSVSIDTPPLSTIEESKLPAAKSKHLFILAGQSNMYRLDPAVSFQPTIEGAFKEGRILIVKDAVGGQPIRRWDKQWNATLETEPGKIGDLYDQLLAKVQLAIEGQRIRSVTLVWMQGERDAREGLAGYYATSLSRLIQQLKTDLDRKDIYTVIGRLSDFDMTNSKYPHWTRIREIQMGMAILNPKIEWVDTDDLNDGVNAAGKMISNDLHLTEKGYAILGQRFACKAIELIKGWHSNTGG